MFGNGMEMTAIEAIEFGVPLAERGARAIGFIGKGVRTGRHGGVCPVRCGLPGCRGGAVRRRWVGLAGADDAFFGVERRGAGDDGFPLNNLIMIAAAAAIGREDCKGLRLHMRAVRTTDKEGPATL